MKNVVITAGAGGIGLALARAFMERGYRVAVCDVDAAAVGDFARAYPEQVAAVADVTCESDMREFFAAAAGRGGVDVLCANAGTGGPAGRIDSLDLGEWRRCLSVNLDGAFLACKYAAPQMRRGGVILLTASTAGIAGYPMRSAYAAAKWGIVGLAKTLAMELGSAGIRVNALCPGAVEGERMERVLRAEAAAHGKSIDEMRRQYVRGVSLQTWVRADDVAAMALFLASDAAAKVSGQVVCIDGHTETLAPSLAP